MIKEVRYYNNDNKVVHLEEVEISNVDGAYHIVNFLMKQLGMTGKNAMDYVKMEIKLTRKEQEELEKRMGI